MGPGRDLQSEALPTALRAKGLKYKQELNKIHIDQALSTFVR